MKSLQRNCTEFKVKSFSWKKRRVISRDGRVDVHLEGGVGLDKEGEHERVEGEEV